MAAGRPRGKLFALVDPFFLKLLPGAYQRRDEVPLGSTGLELLGDMATLSLRVLIAISSEGRERKRHGHEDNASNVVGIELLHVCRFPPLLEEIVPNFDIFHGPWNRIEITTRFPRSICWLLLVEVPGLGILEQTSVAATEGLEHRTIELLSILQMNERLCEFGHLFTTSEVRALFEKVVGDGILDAFYYSLR